MQAINMKGKILGYILLATVVIGGAYWLALRKAPLRKSETGRLSVSQPAREETAKNTAVTAENNSGDKTLLEQFHAIPFKKTKLEDYDQISNLCKLIPVEDIKTIYPQPVKKVYPKAIPGAKWCKIDYADGITLTIEYQKGVSFITPLNRLKNKADASSDKSLPLRNLIIQDRTDNEEVVYLQVSSNGNLISIFFEKPDQSHLPGHLDVLKEVARKIGEAIIE